MVTAVVALTAAGPGAGQELLTWPRFRELPSPAPDARATWGEHAEAFGHLWLPRDEGPHPVVILVHGGCWQSIADVGYVGHLGRALADGGWAVWAPEFRRVDQAPWPATLMDVGRAADALRDVAGLHALDLTRVAAIGHSSGGHLALWLAGRRALSDSGVEAPLRGGDPLPVGGVVALAAIADLADFHDRGGGGCGREAVARLLGATPNRVPDRLDVASPSSRLPLGVPQLFLHGALDPTVPVEHAEAWVRTAVEAGDDAHLLRMPDAGHFEPVAPWTPSFQEAWPDVRRFLESLPPSPPPVDP